MTSRYLQETGKYYYVTPMSYMRLLKNLRKMHKLKIEELEKKRDIYKNGVAKLNLCGEIVDKMKIELEALKPILIVKT
jgi:dynein heavy chain